MLDVLTPVAAIDSKGMYYVPVWRGADSRYQEELMFQVDNNFVRNFTKEELPDTLKVRVAMLYALDPPDNLMSTEMCDLLHLSKNFECGIEGVGWWINKWNFILYVEDFLLNEMKGSK